MADPKGFPGRSSHDEFGGTRENRFRVTRPRQEIGAREYSALQWQVAGMNKLAPLVSLTIDDNGDKLAGGEAWNSADEPSRRVAITHPATGVYVIAAQASSYTDWRGDSGPLVAVVFTGVQVTASSAVAIGPPTWVINSATQVTVYTWDAAGVATDMPFTVDIK